MQPSNDHNSIYRDIQKSIESGRVCMRPRWHFILRAGLSAVGAVLVFLTLLYLTSFILFALRESGVLFVPAFGRFGWWVFLLSLPWVLIIFILFFILLLEIMVRRYAFAYRRPLLYSAIGIMVLVASGGFVVAATPLHHRMVRLAERRDLPLAGPMYHHYRDPRLRNVHPGEVTAIQDRGFAMQNRRSEVIMVTITSTTRLPTGAVFYPGDMVVVFGERANGVIQAFGVRKIGQHMRMK